MEVILEQLHSSLQLLPKDFGKGLMGQVSRSTNLAYTWRVEMKRDEDIKEGGAMRMGDRKIKKETL